MAIFAGAYTAAAVHNSASVARVVGAIVASITAGSGAAFEAISVAPNTFDQWVFLPFAVGRPVLVVRVAGGGVGVRRGSIWKSCIGWGGVQR